MVIYLILALLVIRGAVVAPVSSSGVGRFLVRISAVLLMVYSLLLLLFVNCESNGDFRCRGG